MKSDSVPTSRRKDEKPISRTAARLWYDIKLDELEVCQEVLRKRRFSSEFSENRYGAHLRRDGSLHIWETT